MGDNRTVHERIRKNVSLKGFTTFQLGGPAEFFFEARTEEDLQEGIAYARAQGMPWFVMGGGSNLVVSDEGFDGLVIRNCATDVERFDAATGRLTLSSGRNLGDVVQTAQRLGLHGLEVLTGIPGTLGGAVYGNAWAYGRCVGDMLVEARVLFPDGVVRTVTTDFFDFSYRTSILKQEPHVVINATFALEPGDPGQVLDRMEDILAQRRGKHPPRHVGCAGSFFKNLPPLPGEDRRRPAGKLLEDAGAKSLSFGGASVYEKHANFIVNYGQATARDVRALAAMLKAKVRDLFAVELHEEVLYVGR